MKEYKRDYPLFSACGLNCGLCPRYHTEGSSKCPGCAGEGFFLKHPSCGALSCSQKRGLEYCFQCEEYPCKKYDGADAADSFISHRNRMADFERAKTDGLESYEAMLNEKVELLEFLLKSCNDGRRKNFYCIAVNLLPLEDVREIAEKLRMQEKEDRRAAGENNGEHNGKSDGKSNGESAEAGGNLKAKAALAVSLFEDRAKERNVVLKLRNKKSLQKAKTEK